MGLLDDAFTQLSSLCVDTFAQGANVIIRRVGTGSASATTLARTETNTDVSVAAIRSLSTREFAGAGGGRGNVTMEGHTYQVKTADLGGFVPREGDRVIDGNGPRGASAEYFVTRVTDEVNGTMVRIAVRSTPVRA